MTTDTRIPLGSTGLSFSRFLLGTGALGGIATLTGPGIGLDDEQSAALLERSLGLGINVLDTADIYAQGESERILGRWLAEHPDADVVVETKTGFTPDGPDLSPARIEAQLAQSRRTLGRVDLYLAHTVDPATPWSDSLPVFDAAIERGAIRAYGVSNVSEGDLTEVLETADRLGIRRPALVQNRYSLLSREDDDGVLPIAREQSLGYTPYSPLAAGLLARRYRQGEEPAHGSRLSTAAPALDVLDDAATWERIGRFERLAADRGTGPAALALAWLLHHPGVTAPILGISKPSHWDAVTAADGLEWSGELAAAIDEIFPGR